MALHFNFTSLARALQNRAREIDQGVESTVRRAALTTVSVAAIATPVDTGLARGNWRTRIGSPEEEVINTPRSVAQVVGEATAEVRQWTLTSPDIFVTNNVEYIGFLDEGSSLQAPNGMTEQAIAAGLRVLQQIRVFRRP